MGGGGLFLLLPSYSSGHDLLRLTKVRGASTFEKGALGGLPGGIRDDPILLHYRLGWRGSGWFWSDRRGMAQVFIKRLWCRIWL